MGFTEPCLHPLQVNQGGWKPLLFPRERRVSLKHLPDRACLATEDDIPSACQGFASDLPQMGYVVGDENPFMCLNATSDPPHQ
jgi:hypothetical protein